MPKIILIAHNIRSCHNVGSVLRTADGFNVLRVYLTGYTPYPKAVNDPRMPHEANKIHQQIRKTALGAEESLSWDHAQDILKVIKGLRNDGYQIAALEQTPSSVHLNTFTPIEKIALIVGNEVNGLEKTVLDTSDIHLEIPMRGQKESFNVSVAAGIALYALSFST